MHIKKRTKNKIKKFCQGSISLFLCLLITPFMTLGLALTEFVRYQQTAELAYELMDSSALSVLANFDEYLERRFGIFGLSNQCNADETYKNIIGKNKAMLGKSITIDDNYLKASPSAPLSETDVLKAQLLDFSENTVMIEILLEDLQIKELLEKINNLGVIEKISNVSTAVGDTSEAVLNVAEKGQELVAKIDGLIKSLGDFKTRAEGLIGSFKTFVSKFSDGAEITFEKIKDEYIEDVKSIYTECRGLINDGKKIVEDAKSLKTTFDEMKTSLKNAKESLSKTKDAMKSTSEEQSGKAKENLDGVASTTNKSYEDAINAFEGAIKSSGEAFVDEVKSNLESSLEDLKKNLVRELGNIADEAKGKLDDYFSGELSADAVKDLGDFANLLKDFYDAYKADPENGIEKKIKEEIIPQCFFDTNLSNLREIVNNTVSSALDSIGNTFKESAEGFLKKLIDSINKIFNMDFVFNADMNAFVGSESIVNYEEDNPFINLLNAILKFIEAGNNLFSALNLSNGLGIIERAKKIIEGVKNFFEGIGETFNAIIAAANAMIDNISDLTLNISNGNWQYLYERLLLTGYAVHNFPNRTSGEYDFNTGKVELKGEALTGYKFCDIKLPTYGGQNADNGEQGINKLTAFVDQYKSAFTTSEMFKGAELEYLAVGTQSEIMNQVAVFMQIYMLRMMLDVIPVLCDTGLGEIAAAANIFGWAVYLAAILVEPLVDTLFLVNGVEIPFAKTSVFVSPNGIDNLINTLLSATNSDLVQNAASELGVVKGDADNGIFNMDYKTHVLLILLFTTTPNKLTIRLSNLINIETKFYYKQNGFDGFTLNSSYTIVNTEAEVKLNSFADVFRSGSSSGAEAKGLLKREKGY